LESVGIKRLIMDQSLGEIAYAAYCEAVGYKSVHGETLPNRDDQSERLQEAWERAAEAVAEFLEKS
jgi:mannitol-1-phosphate/altronate dehydrogenase